MNKRKVAEQLIKLAKELTCRSLSRLSVVWNKQMSLINIDAKKRNWLRVDKLMKDLALMGSETSKIQRMARELEESVNGSKHNKMIISMKEMMFRLKVLQKNATLIDVDLSMWLREVKKDIKMLKEGKKTKRT